jgi:DNA polymerase III subunit gamma/tau
MWDLRYRPKNFTDVLGQEGAVQVLKTRLRLGTALDSSYIFSGGHGNGKTSLARVLARAMLCEHLTDDQEPCNECVNCQAILSDTSLAFHERDAASQGTVAIIRQIVDDLPFVVPGAAKQIHLFDEAHRMSNAAQDVLLKPIEEKDMVGIFCTTEPDKIRGAIRSRCEEHRIRKITREHIAERLKLILQVEQVEYEEDALFTVIDISGGHVRDILNRMEMISQAGVVSVEAVRDYLGLGLTTTYYEILLSLDDPTKSIPLIEDACDQVGAEEVSVGLAEAAMNTYRLAHKMFAEFTYVDRTKAEELYRKYGPSIVGYTRKFLSAHARTKVGLICDVVALTTTMELPQQISVAPAPQLPLHSPPNPVSPVSAPIATSQPSPPSPPIPLPSPQVLAPISSVTNGKAGNLGTDPMALTTLDEFGVPKDLPRGHEEGDKRVVTASKEEKVLPSGDWKRAFERSWRG